MATQPVSITNSNQGQPYLIARVTSIILGPWDPLYKRSSDIGKIRYQLLYSPSSDIGASPFANFTMNEAYPVDRFIKSYPLVNEIVMIVMGPSVNLNDSKNGMGLFYFSPYDFWKNANHSAFPDLKVYAGQLRDQQNDPAYQGTNTTGSVYLGYTFTEKEVRELQPFEGDSIMQARFGQSMRFGSTVAGLRKSNTWSKTGNNGDPITIITNRLEGKSSDKFDTAVEDINRDGSSIYMTSTQEIMLEDLIKFPLKSFGVTITSVNQVVLEAPVPFPISNYGVSPQEQDSQALGGNQSLDENSAASAYRTNEQARNPKLD